MSEPAPGPVLEAVYRVFAPSRAKAGRLWTRWRTTLLEMRPLGAISPGNSIELFCEGDAAFEAQWRAIGEAREQILVNMYHFADDRVGRRMRDELVAAAERGVRVHVQLDAFATSLDDAFLEPFRASQVSFSWFNPPFRFRTRFARLMRNHRKLLVLDGLVAFVGGMNVSEDYAGERFGNGLFRDTHLRVEGPAARDLGLLAASVLDDKLRPDVATPAASVYGDTLVQVLESNVRRERRAIQRALALAIRHATDRCWLTSPYFVPPRSLRRAMERAAKDGVDVRVLTAGDSDVPMVRRASQHLYGRLLKRGIRVFELERRTLHAKTAVVDGVWGSVGSFNLDQWSYRRNLEVTVALLDEDLARDLEAAFHDDLETAREVNLGSWRDRPWWLRLGHWFAYLLMRI